MYVHPYVCTSIRPQRLRILYRTLRRYINAVLLLLKSFSDFSEIWYVDRGRWVMHDGMPYDPIQGQGQGHEYLKATQEESTVSPARD